MKIKIYTLWAILLIGKPLLGQNVTLAMCLEAAQKTSTSTKQKEIEQELQAKELILNKFEAVAETYKKQQEQEKQLKADSKLINAVIGTLSKEKLDNAPYSDKYEPISKKGPKILVTSSIASKNILGYERANFFGNKFNSFPNKDNIFGVIVTSANESGVQLCEHSQISTTKFLIIVLPKTVCVTSG